MSELEKTKNELRESLERIPASGSFEGARLATRVSELAVIYANLVSQMEPKKSSQTALASATTEHPEEKSEVGTP